MSQVPGFPHLPNARRTGLGELPEVNRRQTLMLGAGLLAAAAAPITLLGQRSGQFLDDAPDVQHPFDAPATVPGSGTYLLQQKATGRYAWAYENSNDYRMRTEKLFKGDLKEQWIFKSLGDLCYVQHLASRDHGYITAFADAAHDYGMYTETNPLNTYGHRWVFLRTAVQHVYYISHWHTGRLADAYPAPKYRMVTRGWNNNASQRWILSNLNSPSGGYRIQQQSSGLFATADPGGQHGMHVSPSTDDLATWRFHYIGAVYTIQQASTKRYVDASSQTGYHMVTRPASGSDRQRWVVIPSADNTYTLQQLFDHRYVDAIVDPTVGSDMLTAPGEGNATQRWTLIKV